MIKNYYLLSKEGSINITQFHYLHQNKYFHFSIFSHFDHLHSLFMLLSLNKFGLIFLIGSVDLIIHKKYANSPAMVRAAIFWQEILPKDAPNVQMWQIIFAIIGCGKLEGKFRPNSERFFWQ